MKDARHFSRLHDDLQDKLDNASSIGEAKRIKRQIMSNLIDMKKAGVHKKQIRSVFGYGD